MVHHKDTELNADTPILLYAYGSYGSTIDPNFSTTRLSLLDRGFAFAIAHVRGGEYMGRNWYDDGKLFKKKNTFSDFHQLLQVFDWSLHDLRGSLVCLRWISWWVADGRYSE